jgi:hypothetical protein
MLNDHKILQAKALGGGTVEFEVNWNSNKDIANCEMVRLRFDGVEVDVKRDELVNVLLHIGSLSDQKKLMPVKVERVRKLERMLTFEFTAKRDIPQGQKVQVTAPWIDTTVDAEEVLSGNLKKQQKFNPLKRFAH